MDQQQIIMNFSVPPSEDDIRVIALEQIENLPDELVEHCEDIVIQIEEFADEATEADLELEDLMNCLPCLKGGNNWLPVLKKRVPMMTIH